MTHQADLRRGELARMAEDVWDVLIVGGGIVGAGVARDAAMRGMRVALIEQHDFASGTSSRTSRLLHGGLRYLSQGRLALVRQASREKGIMCRIARHLCEPLPFIVPVGAGIYRRLWPLRLGVRLYDLLSGRENFGPSRTLSREELLEQVPQWTGRVTGGVCYYDALTCDSRLVLDTLRSAARHGACILNYARFQDARREGTLWRADVDSAGSTSTLKVRARSIVNAAGPWADRLPRSRVHLRPTKGIHLVLDRARLPVTAAVVLSRDARILFVIPWGARVIVGTTDTDYHGSPEEVRPEAPDVAYLLGVLNQWFGNLGVRADDVRSTWAGVRPLVARGTGRPSDISRGHRIDAPEPGWIDVTGGKLTTYRCMAAEVVDRVAGQLPRRYPRARTDLEPLLSPDEQASSVSVIPPVPTQELVQRFCLQEWSRHLDDVMLRRGCWHHYVDDPINLGQRVATWMQPLLGWSDDEHQAECERYSRLVAEAHVGWGRLIST